VPQRGTASLFFPTVGTAERRLSHKGRWSSLWLVLRSHKVAAVSLVTRWRAFRPTDAFTWINLLWSAIRPFPNMAPFARIRRCLATPFPTWLPVHSTSLHLPGLATRPGHTPFNVAPIAQRYGKALDCVILPTCCTEVNANSAYR
jgi:hypothetical protein